MSVRRHREFAALQKAGWVVLVDSPWDRLGTLLRLRRLIRRWSR
jgi:hypothetical protein